jgi:hypothetical protein
MAPTKSNPASPMVKRLFMTAPPFLLHCQLVSTKSVSQSGSYEHTTVSLFDLKVAQVTQNAIIQKRNNVKYVQDYSRSFKNVLFPMTCTC